MSSYIPVISEIFDTQHDACLVDAEKLLEYHELDGAIIVSKAVVYTLSCDDWWFSIEDNGQQVVIIEHCSGFKCPDSVDIVEMLGHELTLLPGQKLLFHTDGNIEQTVSFVEIGKLS